MNKRRIEDLAKLEGRVYLHFRDTETLERFIRDAESEGYHYADGVFLRDRRPQFRMALNDDHTINFLGFAGMWAFDIAEEVGHKKLIRIDYARYIASEEDYIIAKSPE